MIVKETMVCHHMMMIWLGAVNEGEEEKENRMGRAVVHAGRWYRR